ncbi:MAG: hypothetical protein OQK19_04650 [Sedimenticola sp.]|uniref:Uncharacterized protein n=1 Tax=Sedimenticola thiotaurini TaxID=1543721 RepID=A0A558D0S0_9GAMM|nr:hypothetical protein [Sedimenticola sp.]TVT54568.1 MAG: hypothetical protein FHK82_10265 [Sedimenticola thiotaurini]MCW8881855.1 hypothetical protein [Sedimenticola sp.]MCW8947370.1 hypothetical protein [Sedimenticola sp.]MCW8950722.1 hypothetical protein [Sedimenticola sp.]
MSRRSDRDEYDDLDEWTSVVHHKNRKQNDGARTKRPQSRENEGGARKPGSPRRQGNRHPGEF